MATTAEVREAFQMAGEGVDFKRVFAEQGAEFDAWLTEQVVEAHKAGYRDGFLTGRAGQMTAYVDSLLPKPAPKTAPKPRALKPKCEDCGHAAVTHNELGYCQARGKKNSDGCHCDYFRDSAREAEVRAWHAANPPAADRARLKPTTGSA